MSEPVKKLGCILSAVELEGRTPHQMPRQTYAAAAQRAHRRHRM